MVQYIHVRIYRFTWHCLSSQAPAVCPDSTHQQNWNKISICIPNPLLSLCKTREQYGWAWGWVKDAWSFISISLYRFIVCETLFIFESQWSPPLQSVPLLHSHNIIIKPFVLFIARFSDGHSVTSGILISGSSVAGLYNVAVIVHFVVVQETTSQRYEGSEKLQWHHRGSSPWPSGV
jgi:hypothetical protein